MQVEKSFLFLPLNAKQTHSECLILSLSFNQILDRPPLLSGSSQIKKKKNPLVILLCQTISVQELFYIHAYVIIKISTLF